VHALERSTAINELRGAGSDEFGTTVRLAGTNNLRAWRRTTRTDEFATRTRARAWTDHLPARRRTIGRMLQDGWLGWRRAAAWMLLRRRTPPMVFIVLRCGQAR
jgi:hypothetical protein